MTPTADHSDYEGYFVKNSSGSAALCDSASDDPLGVILDGEDTDGQDSIGLLGGMRKTAHVKLAGTVSQFGLIQLTSAGKAEADAGTGARVIVGRVLEAGVADEKVEAILFTPVAYT